MEITEVRIKLMEDSDDRLQAFCSITFDDCFVVRDLKIIEGTNGPFVAMPSRKLTFHCPQCGAKNHLRSGYCNHCGTRLREDRAPRDSEGRAKLYADIAHPINSTCREMIQNRVISEYKSELERAVQPGYMSRYDDDYLDDYDVAEDDLAGSPESHRPARARTEVQPPVSEPRPPHRMASRPNHPVQQPRPAQVPAVPPAQAPSAPAQASPGYGSPTPLSPPPPSRSRRPPPTDRPRPDDDDEADFGAGIFD